MGKREWYDVIDITHGSREIAFSCKELDKAMEKAEILHNEGNLVYIKFFSLEPEKGNLVSKLIDPYENFVPYVVIFDEDEIRNPSKKRKQRKNKEHKKEYKF